MANMSYCRFQNTLNDFIDCVENLDNISSKEEKSAAKGLYEYAQEYVERFEELNEEEG